MLTPELLFLPCIATLAFFVKAVTGFGPAIVLIALGSMVVAPQSIIVAGSLLDIVAGIALMRIDAVEDGRGFWGPLAVSVVGGSIMGGLLLRYLPPEPFRIIMSLSLLALGGWFLMARAQAGKASSRNNLVDQLPERPGGSDAWWVFLGGFTGGLIGISGPPIVWHFGKRFAKITFRRILLPIFLAAAIARSVTYGATGLIDSRALLYAGICLPGLAAGVYLGNHLFMRISERTFSRAIGILLLIVGVDRLFF